MEIASLIDLLRSVAQIHNSLYFQFSGNLLTFSLRSSPSKTPSSPPVFPQNLHVLIPVRPSVPPCPPPPLSHRPVEGQWLEWGPWSRCSVTCNTGTQQRQRRCSASVHGWAECKGPHQESRECANPSCSGKAYKWMLGIRTHALSKPIMQT